MTIFCPCFGKTLRPQAPLAQGRHGRHGGGSDLVAKRPLVKRNDS